MKYDINSYIFSVIGLIVLSSITTGEMESRGDSDREVWRRCIQDIQHNIIHTISDIIKV